ncbi:hypothetical protein BDP55DRAFT_632110 [Colletotrichum godetiae]|uniref:Uncharacterized protein n=1 Tax=Colletotrichum godetiae TaxID=1209918 RepID=A0AAJ0AK84_9PEZI|nr:uncharacterized protein BDP55DRAFT_632110 [Colletotrichum godetiae]KAK1675423.1 hypothetical protein BDP55DRAFT_632110 [Colletotrichum godetiae]
MSVSAGPVISTSPSPHPFPLLEPRDGRLTNDNRHVHGHDHGHGQAGAFSWPPRFFRRQSISKNWENSPWVTAVVETKSETLSPEEPEESDETIYLTPEEPGEEDTIFFLITEENWAADKSRVAPLVAFLQRAKLEELQQRASHIPPDNIAILIDGNFSESKVCPRQYLGALSAVRLLEELQKKRYHETSTGEEGDTRDADAEADAERRLIYVVDTDRWAVLALVGSAPESLYRQLPDFLLNYILSKPSLGVHFSTEGPETFVMEFSFPYCVWRTSKTLMRDHRSKSSDREYLRSSRDVTFLRALAGSQASSDGIDAIYSSHISCIVTGYDQFRWTCLLLCEAWFEVEVVGLPTPDSIARYEGEQEDVVESLGVVKLSDPLRRGKSDMFDTTATMWLPRPYFLRVLEIRLGQIYKEFQGLFYNFDKWMTGIDEEHRRLLQRLRKSARVSQITTRWDDVLDELDEFEEGILLAEGIVKSLSQTMEGVVSIGDLFMTTDVNYFLHTEGRPGDISACYPYLSQIRRTFSDLRQLRIRFGNLETQYQGMIKNGLAARDQALLRMKFKKAQPVAGLSPVSIPPSAVVPQQSMVVSISAWMTTISQPLVNIAAVFGCDEIIRYTRTPGNFLISLALMSLGMIIIVWICIRLASGDCEWPFVNRSGDTGTTTHANTNSRDNSEETIGGSAARSIQRRTKLPTRFNNWLQRPRVEEHLPFRATIPHVPHSLARVELAALEFRGATDSQLHQTALDQTSSVARVRERA